MIKLATKFELRQANAFRDLESAVALERSGLIAEADNAYARVIRKNPDYFDALHIHGLFKFKTGQMIDAVRLIERAVKINPRSLNALNSLGVLYGNLELTRGQTCGPSKPPPPVASYIVASLIGHAETSPCGHGTVTTVSVRARRKSLLYFVSAVPSLGSGSATARFHHRNGWLNDYVAARHRCAA